MHFVIILIYSLRFTYNVNEVFLHKKLIVKCYYSCAFFILGCALMIFGVSRDPRQQNVIF